MRALSSIVENTPGSAEMARVAAYRLYTWGLKVEAASLLYQVILKRPFEPQSYRDLANALWLSRPGLAALLYETVLSGEWNAQFRSIKTVVEEEYALMVSALENRDPEGQLTAYLKSRLDALSIEMPTGDLRVTITWNTNNTDIDLWVTDPNDEKCYWRNMQTESGGVLLDDVTRGFGPERFVAEETIPGPYVITVHYYGNNGNSLVAETYVNVTIMTHIGTPDEHISRHSLMLSEPDIIAVFSPIVF